VIERGPGWSLHLGRWQDVLGDVAECDAVITDPPYGERTHSGALDPTTLERGVDYAPLTEDDAALLAGHLSAICTGWVVVQTDDDMGFFLKPEFRRLGRYVFPLVPVLQQMPRVSGDGPGSPGHFIVASRPKEKRFLGWGSLPCWYEAPRDGSIVRGGKPLGLMRAIVRDYSKPGDLIVDPYAGGGTTLLAAVTEGRRAIGAECDPETFAKAVKRLRRGYTPDMFTEAT